MIHAIHALTHARVVLQTLPLAMLPVTLNVMLRQFAGRRRFAFSGDPEWKKLSTTPGYTDPEIVSNISNTYLRPAAYSQI